MRPRQSLKHETLPSREEGNYFICSIQTLPHIQNLLGNFPSDPTGRYLSATGMWSGTEGNNTPLPVYYADNNQQRLGIILDPRELEVPFGFFYPSGTKGKVPVIVKKEGALCPDEYNQPQHLTSKYPEKTGTVVESARKFYLDIASNEHLPNKQLVNKKGNPDTACNNVYRAFFNPKPAKQYRGLNELLCLQRGRKNPITGLYLTKGYDKNGTLQTTVIGGGIAAELLTIFQNHRELELYFYNQTAKEHILRKMNNKDAQDYLRNAPPSGQPAATYQAYFQQGFDKAQPFRGFHSNKAALEEKKEENLPDELTPEQLSTFINLHKADYQYGCWKKTNLIKNVNEYDKLTGAQVLAHARKRTFWGGRNRTLKILTSDEFKNPPQAAVAKRS